ncbi:MAG: hypothetical protein M1822_004799 [Bathelium mastoideum]|nr:MAG: hypothetical protein M1822_004799 [Bathelium mastoideum]
MDLSGKVREKDPALAHAFGSRLGTFGAVEHFTHKRRRAATKAFFSQRSIDNLEPSSRKYITQLDKYLSAMYHADTHVCFDIRPVLLAWGTDSLTGTILGQSRGLLQDESKRREWYRMYDGMREIWPLVRRCPWLIPMALAWPRIAIPLARITLPKLEVLLHLFMDMNKLAALKAERTIVAMSKEEGERATFQSDVFDAIVRSDLPECEKEPYRMAHEAIELVGGGGATTPKGICDGLYFVLSSQRIYRKLKQELTNEIPAGSVIPAARKLQQFPYLNAVIKETLRISRVVALRSAARAPTEELYYNGLCLKPGVTVSMTLSTAMTREDIFPDPLEFLPERWLENPEKLSAMERYFVPFGLGNRSCVGRSFAVMQMHSVFAMLFRRYEMRLADTDRARDVDPHRTWATNEPHPSSKGISISILAIDRDVKIVGI